MSTTTIAVTEAAVVLQEESHRIAALGPVLTQGQLRASILDMRLALAKLESYAPMLPVEHPAAPVPERLLGPWP